MIRPDGDPSGAPAPFTREAFEHLVATEARAERIRGYIGALPVLGLLQQHEYGRAILAQAAPSLLTPNERDAMLSHRITRQQKLADRSVPIEFFVAREVVDRLEEDHPRQAQYVLELVGASVTDPSGRVNVQLVNAGELDESLAINNYLRYGLPEGTPNLYQIRPQPDTYDTRLIVPGGSEFDQVNSFLNALPAAA